MDEGSAATAEQYESLAARVRGVYRCEVALQEGEPVPVRVRLIADMSRRTLVARDVQSALFTAFDVYVPLEQFEVLALRRADVALTAAGARPALQNIAYEREGEQQRVRISVRHAQREATGVAEAGPADDRLRACATAALAAVAAVRGWDAVPVLEDARTVPTGDRVAVVVHVRVAVGPRDPDIRLGIALVRGDACEAAVRAALQALNRVEPAGAVPPERRRAGTERPAPRPRPI